MNEQFLCRCINNIEANMVANVLDENSIEYRMHDEKADQRNGAYGPNPGMVFYVSEQDYQKASILVNPIINRSSVRDNPFCPKCGSEDTVPISRFKYTTAIQLISIPMFIAPVVCIYYSKEWSIICWIAVVVFIFSIILVIISSEMSKNYKCNNCGKRFNRM